MHSPGKKNIKISPDNKNWASEFKDAVNNHGSLPKAI